MTRNFQNRLISRTALASLAALIIFCLASCGPNGVSVSLDPKAPSEGNFKKAIDEYLAANEKYGKVCIEFDGIPPFEGESQYDNLPDSSTRIMEAAGLLRSSPVAGGRMTRYDVTEAGRKAIVREKDDPNRSHVCWANTRVDTIVKWVSDPQNNSMDVSWTYKLTDVADWTKGPEPKKYNNISLVVDDAGKKVYEAVLKLSNKGWECVIAGT